MAETQHIIPAAAARYGYVVPDNAMAPQFAAGDLAIIDPDLPVRPGDTVAVVEPSGAVLFIAVYGGMSRRVATFSRHCMTGAFKLRLGPGSPLWRVVGQMGADTVCRAAAA